MTTRVLTLWAIAAACAAASCTVSQSQDPALTGPSEFATSVTVAAEPDVISLGQIGTTVGQSSQVTVRAFDANGQPKAKQALKLETVVNGQTSSCGRLSTAILTTGADGRAQATFTAPGTPPNCPNFNQDGTVTVRATPVGSQVDGVAGGTVNIYMAPPSASSGGSFSATFSMSQIAGSRNFQFDATSSVSPGHAITSYVWTFSDGTTKSGAVVSHDFGSAGTYFVTLTVTDDSQQVSFKTALVSVN